MTGILEDENARRTRFCTMFVQDVAGSEDGDPRIWVSIAIFARARLPSLAIGDIALFGGYVFEFYGQTEIDNNDLSAAIVS